MLILYSDVIDSFAIDTHSPSLVFLWDKKHENCTKTHALTNVSFRHQLLHLLLEFFRLFRIAPICRPIWYRCFWNKVDLMFNPTNWRQATRNLFWRQATRNALTNVSFRHQLLHLLLEFFRLFRIAPISRPIWYRCFWNKVDLMFNPPNWRQATRNLFWKDIFKFL